MVETIDATKKVIAGTAKGKKGYYKKYPNMAVDYPYTNKDGTEKKYVGPDAPHRDAYSQTPNASAAMSRGYLHSRKTVKVSARGKTATAKGKNEGYWFGSRGKGMYVP